MQQLDKDGLTEEEYIERYQRKNYPRPYLTADIIIFGEERKKVLLIRRGGHPFIGQWAFPGGFAESTETIEHTAQRELEEETGLTGINLLLLGVFSRPGRDPRGWNVSTAFTATVDIDKCDPHAGDDAQDAQWFDLKTEGTMITLTGEEAEIVFDYSRTEEGIKTEFQTPDILGFDHAEMLVRALDLYGMQ